jgi:hypothetical protein
MKNLNILENIVVFILDIHLWSGRKKLKAEDLAMNGVEVDKLPPGTLASLGSKKIISSEALAPFSAIKREAEKLCLAKGVRFLGGYAVAAQEAQELDGQLTQLQNNFEQARVQLLQDYDVKVRDWINVNPPEWAAVIRASVDPQSKVQQALGFAYTPIKIAATTEIESESNPLQYQTQGLYAQLCQEIRYMASSAYSASYEGKNCITRKALRPISSIKEKLAALEFLSPDIADVIADIDRSIDLVPASGAIQGYALDQLNLLLRGLSRLGLVAEEVVQGHGCEQEQMVQTHGADLRACVPHGSRAKVCAGQQERQEREDTANSNAPTGLVALAWDF